MFDPLTARSSARPGLSLRLAEGAIVLGTTLGFALSYSALRRLSERHGYDGWEAALWPLAVDAVAVATTALAMLLAERRHGPTGETWTLAGASALVSLGGNVLSAWGDPIAMAMHAWAAAIYVGLWHNLFRVARNLADTPERGGQADPAAATPAPLTELVDERPAAAAALPAWPGIIPVPAPERPAERPVPRSPQRSRRRSAGDPRAQVRALVRAADERGERLIGTDIARALGRSPQRARALIAEVRAEVGASNGNGHGPAAE